MILLHVYFMSRTIFIRQLKIFQEISKQFLFFKESGKLQALLFCIEG